MPRISYDLHIHSALSPCGDDDMTPGNIVGMSKLKELDVIALTDHNSCRNCPAIMKIAKEYGLTVIPGMELTTIEEVHVLCLFAELSDAMRFDEYVYSHLLPIPNKEAIFGKQQIFNEEDEVTGKLEYLLLGSTDISFDAVYDLVSEYNGIMIPAHIDKSSNSLLHNLGFVPPDSKFTCVEIKDHGKTEEIIKSNPYIGYCTIIHDSDAHFLEHINEAVHFLDVPSLEPRDILQTLVKT